jgi:hypothetical protein
MAEKPTLKELKKYSKKLNDQDLLDDPIDLDGEYDDIQQEFIEAMEECEDEGVLAKVKKPIIKFYNGLVDFIENSQSGDDNGEDGDDFDRDELEEELEDMKLKDLKAYVSDNDLDIDTKITTKTKDEAIEEILDAMEAKAEGGDGGTSGDEAEDDNGVADLEETLSEMSVKELRAYAKENGYDVKVTKKTFDDAVEAIVALAEKEGDDNGDADEDGDDFDRDEMEETLEEMDYKALKAFIKENGLQPETKLKKKTFDDDQEDIIEEILDELEERAEEGDDKPAGKAKAPETKKDAPKKGAPQRKKGVAIGDVVAQAYAEIKEKGKAFTPEDVAKKAAAIREDAGEVPSLPSCRSYSKMVAGALQAMEIVTEKKGKLSF